MMANVRRFKIFAKLIVLMAVLKYTVAELSVPDPGKSGQKDQSRNVSPDGKYQLTIDGQHFSRNENADKSDIHGVPKEGKSAILKDGLNNSNRDLYRRNQESKSDSSKSQSNKWTGKMEDYFRKSNGEAFGGKSLFRPIKEGKTLDPNVIKSGENASAIPSFRNHDEYSSPKHASSEENEEYLTTGNRQRKMKKHGGSGSFIPFPPASRERKPNIILILTDDQDVELGSLNFMPKTLRLLRDGGAEFRHAYVTTPMCCPSRSSLLTGMYVHNHNVFTNNDNCSNVQWQQTHETRTFATYLSNAGYRTGYFGKYLNKYNGSYIPPGWREWGGLIMNSRYYNYSINLNGKKVKHGFDYHKDYYPDLIANDSITFLRQSKQYFSRKPVMLVVSFPAPHGPEDSAPQYSKMFFNVTTHHTPSYDYAPNPDKQWILRVTNKMQNIHKQFTDILMTKRLQTLQSVDVAVERIYQELKNIGELDNTYIIYTSDHGYHLGQFGLVKGKSFPFEFDVRVPFLVRGPGIEAGAVVDDIVLNIDLAPTFLDLAGVELPIHMDGRSIVRLLHNKSNKRRRFKWPDTFLIESSGRREMPETLDAKRLKQEKQKAKEKGFAKSGISQGEKIRKTVRQQEEEREESAEGLSGDEAENENFDEEEGSDSFNQEVYDDGLLIPLDSFSQVENKIPQLAQDMTQPIPKLARLALECQNPELQSPCRPGQKWHCVVDGDRWRKYKCKFQKKCTCFTPNGFMYAALYQENEERKLDFGNKKSNEFDSWRESISRLDSSTVPRSGRVTGRKRRETSRDHVLDVWDLEQELIETEKSEMAMNATISFGQEPNASRCLVTTQGKVNCSRLIYNDLKTWKRSRNKIESKIKRLKSELEALKEIRKHLREKRPDPGTVVISNSSKKKNPVSIESTANNSSIEFITESLTTVTVVGVRKSHNDTISGSRNFSETSGTTRMWPDSAASTETTLTATTQRSVTFDAKKAKETEIKKSGSSNRKYNNSDDGDSNRINGVLTVFRGTDKCICRVKEPNLEGKKEEKDLAKEARRRLKQKRMRKKEKKLKKKAKLDKECLSEKMNCFSHDNDHWKTPPFWTAGHFCFCMNANNNTFSCLRTINSTHNFLYCEFTTGFKTYYNLRIDPFEQLNRISTLSLDESRFLSNQLADMKACRGSKECTVASGKENSFFGHHHSPHRQHSYLPHAYNSAIKKEFIY